MQCNTGAVTKEAMKQAILTGAKHNPNLPYSNYINLDYSRNDSHMEFLVLNELIEREYKILQQGLEIIKNFQILGVSL